MSLCFPALKMGALDSQEHEIHQNHLKSYSGQLYSKRNIQDTLCISVKCSAMSLMHNIWKFDKDMLVKMEKPFFFVTPFFGG